MRYKLFVAFLIVALVNFLFGCYSFESVAVPEYENVGEEESKPDEIYVTTKDSQRYRFLDTGYYIENDTLYGKGVMIVESFFGDNEKPFEGKFALADIESIEVEYLDGEKIIGKVLLLAALTVVFMLIMKGAIGDMPFGTKK